MKSRSFFVCGLQIVGSFASFFATSVKQEFRRFLVKKADYSKQYNILGLDFL